MISSYSGKQGNCINVDRVDNSDIWGDKLVISETEYPAFFIYTSPENFKAFIQGVKAGEFDHFCE